MNPSGGRAGGGGGAAPPNPAALAATIARVTGRPVPSSGAGASKSSLQAPPAVLSGSGSGGSGVARGGGGGARAQRQEKAQLPPAETEEEMRARKLKEMSENVDWQAGERESRAAEYKLKEAKDAAEDAGSGKERKEGEATFMDEFAKSAYSSTTSIGDRINKNRHYVQRTAADLDKSSYSSGGGAQFR